MQLHASSAVKRHNHEDDNVTITVMTQDAKTRQHQVENKTKHKRATHCILSPKPSHFADMHE